MIKSESYSPFSEDSLIKGILGKVTWSGNGSLVLPLDTGEIFLFFRECGIRMVDP